MNKKTIKLNAKDIIAKRDQLSKDITKNWKTIKTENIMPIKAIKAGLAKYDLNELYNQITQMAQQRIKCKLLLNAINNGKTTFSDEDIHYKTIYEANEIKEQICHLKMIKTINPATKAKAGVKGTGKKETFTSAKLASMIKKLEIQAIALDKKIADFNNTTTIEVDEEFGKTFAA